jgi:hypothetical protein
MSAFSHPNLFPSDAAPAIPSSAMPTQAPSLKSTRKSPTPRAPKPDARVPKRLRPDPPPRVTWGDKVYTYLREHGPATSKEICEAVGLDAPHGVGSYIATRVRIGQVVRNGYRYAIPNERAPEGLDEQS